MVVMDFHVELDYVRFLRGSSPSFGEHHTDLVPAQEARSKPQPIKQRLRLAVSDIFDSRRTMPSASRI